MLLKGLFDKYHKILSIVVTGSARLFFFRKSGDSLFERSHYYRLHPFTLAEVDPNYGHQTTRDLLKFSGFPEPFLQKDEISYKRWKRERMAKVVYQDIADLSLVKEISKIELLVDALPSKVGSLFSIRSLREDLEVAPNTIAKWINIL